MISNIEKLYIYIYFFFFHRRKIKRKKRDSTSADKIRSKTFSWSTYKTLKIPKRFEKKPSFETQLAGTKHRKANMMKMIALLLTLSTVMNMVDCKALNGGSVISKIGFGGNSDNTNSFISRNTNITCHCACRCGHLYQACIKETIRSVNAVIENSTLGNEGRRTQLIKKMQTCHDQKKFCKKICRFVFKV